MSRSSGGAGRRPAAYVLARRGARVTIFDGSHPREKPCGGGVTGRALALVADAVDPAAFPRTVIRSARFTHLRASPLRGFPFAAPPFAAPPSRLPLRGSAATAGQAAASAAQAGATVGTPSLTEAVVPLQPEALVVASRAVFDAALLAAAERAGATLVRTRVSDVSADASGVWLTAATAAAIARRT